jgi:hypothetical protein
LHLEFTLSLAFVLIGLITLKGRWQSRVCLQVQRGLGECIALLIVHIGPIVS